jgi:hypothetical protein
MNTFWDLMDEEVSTFVDIEVSKDATIKERFDAFHKVNPRVYQELKRLALILVNRGHKRIGMQMLFEQMRWQWYERTIDTSGFKLNNDYAAYYSRLLMEQEPELAGVFTTRSVTQDSTTETRS